MKTAARIILIVTATFINTECFRIFEKRQDSDNSDDETSCLENINNCTSTIDDQPFLGHLSYNFGTLAPVIDQICCDYHTAKQCLRPVLESCRRYAYGLEDTDRIIGFFCSNRGKSLLREFQQSVCYNDFPDVIHYGPICIAENSEENREDYFEKLKQCYVRTITAACGEAAGQILSFTLDVYWSNNADNEGDLAVCPNSSCLMAALKINYKPEDWRLFIESSKTSLKPVVLNNENTA